MRDEKGRFVKGNVPWAKLNPHLMKATSGSFKKGHPPPKTAFKKGARASPSTEFKKGWTISTGHYIRERAPNHPFADGEGRVQKHKLVLEKLLGRYLLPSEEAHHINLNRSDNRPENLILFINRSAHRRFHLDPNSIKPEEIIFDGRLLQ